MAKARAIIKQRQAIQNIRKITRTMELIATAKYRKALDRAVQAEAFTRKVAELVRDLGERATSEVSHPLLETREPTRAATLLVLTSNRGLAGGYNGNVIRAGYRAYQDLQVAGTDVRLEVAGKRGIAFLKFRGTVAAQTYAQFDDRPQYSEVEPIAQRYIDEFTTGKIDRVDVAYTRFLSASRQEAVLETLLPMSVADVSKLGASLRKRAAAGEPVARERRFQPVPYEFLPDPASILAEVVPVSFKVRLFKCFLDAAVSEQIARMVAMKGATENAGDMITRLTRLYNRARQTQITRELAEIIGGAAALE